MNKIYYLLLISCLFVNYGFSQQLLGTCGTSEYDNFLIRERMFENREEWKNQFIQRGGAPIYVPVTFHLVAKNDGTGRLPLKNAIENLCCLNNTYSDFGIIFYLKKVNNYNNTYVYDDPSSALSIEYIKLLIKDNKNAVNIIVANTARLADPNVLAFYNPQGDYIVSNKLYVNSDCTTLGHEIGHFFSLAHTFFGWENTDYHVTSMNCTKATPTILSTGNGGTVLVEYVDRDKPGTVSGKKHCEQSADGFCGTPADYNLGLGFTGMNCTYTSCAKDPDGIKLNPDEKNLMSYFLDCIEYFSDDQEEAILFDLQSTGRDYLRSTPYTPKADMTDQLIYITPTVGSPAKGYDTIRFDWEDMPNAEFYIFEIAENLGFNLNPRQFVLNHSDTFLINFKKNFNYYWRVTPYNTNSFCVVPRIITFKTPTWTVASDNIENTDISSYVIESSERASVLIINSIQAQAITLQFLNSNGQVLSSQIEYLQNGENKITIDQKCPGFYIYRIVSKNQKENTGKFIKL